MRTISIFCKSIVILLVAGLSINKATAQTTNIEQITKVYDITPSGSLHIKSERSDIEILKWDRNEVKVVGELTYKGDGSQEDFNKLLNAFKNMNVESSKDVVKLDLILIVSAVSHNMTPSRKMVTETVLCNGDKISINAINIKTAYTIWMPETLALYIDNKNGNLKIEKELRK